MTIPLPTWSTPPPPPEPRVRSEAGLPYTAQAIPMPPTSKLVVPAVRDKRAVVTFLASEVILIWHSVDGLSSAFHPFTDQPANLFTCYAPGISPNVVESVNAHAHNCTRTLPALIDVIYMEYSSGFHVATQEDELHRTLLRELCHSPGLAKRIQAAMDFKPGTATYHRPD